jgi:hypothetical protein
MIRNERSASQRMTSTTKSKIVMFSPAFCLMVAVR